MKKVLSIVLSVMIMLIGIVPAAYAVYTPGIAMRVANGEYAPEASGVSTITDSTFTLVFKFPKVDKLVGVNMYLQFDDSVLEVVEGGQAYKLDDEGGEMPIFNGTFASGLKSGKTNEYSMGIISSKGIQKSSAKDFAYITFKVLDTSATSTTVNLYVNEFNTDDGNDDNEVSSTVLDESKIIKFDFSELETTESSSEEETTDTADAEDVNDLLQMLKDLLKGNGVSFEDYLDAVVNVLGNADITDMIEQLLGGDFSLDGGFLDKLQDLGLDFGALEDILNTIIDFFKGLFGGDNGDETKPASTTQTAVITTQQASETDPATTSGGSQQGSEPTGDAGIALAATVCVAAAAAFALTRKKKED